MRGLRDSVEPKALNISSSNIKLRVVTVAANAMPIIITLLNMLEAPGILFSPMYFPALTDPPIESMKAMPNIKLRNGMIKLIAAKADVPT